MNGKLIWKDLRVVDINWYSSYGYIDIHIPIYLHIPYNSMDDKTPWLIRDACYNHLMKLKWPVEGKDSLYFFYYETYYHLQLLTKNRKTVSFYEGLNSFRLTRQCSTAISIQCSSYVGGNP